MLFINKIIIHFKIKLIIQSIKYLSSLVLLTPSWSLPPCRIHWSFWKGTLLHRLIWRHWSSSSSSFELLELVEVFMEGTIHNIRRSKINVMVRKCLNVLDPRSPWIYYRCSEKIPWHSCQVYNPCRYLHVLPEAFEILRSTLCNLHQICLLFFCGESFSTLVACCLLFFSFDGTNKQSDQLCDNCNIWSLKDPSSFILKLISYFPSSHHLFFLFSSENIGKRNDQNHDTCNILLLKEPFDLELGLILHFSFGILCAW